MSLLSVLHGLPTYKAMQATTEILLQAAHLVAAMIQRRVTVVLPSETVGKFFASIISRRVRASIHREG